METKEANSQHESERTLIQTSPNAKLILIFFWIWKLKVWHNTF